MKTSLALLCVLLISLAASSAQEDEPLWALVQRAIASGGMQKPADTVLQHMASAPSIRPASYKLSRVERGLADPWLPPGLAKELRDMLAKPATKRSGALGEVGVVVSGITDWLDLEPSDSPGILELSDQWEAIADEGLTGRPLLEALSAYLATAHAVLDEALAGLDDGDGAARELLFGRALDFAEVWRGSHDPAHQLSAQENTFLEHWSGRILGKLPSDRATVLGVAHALLCLTDGEFRHGLASRLSKVKKEGSSLSGLSGDVVAVVGEAPEERVILGGRRKTKYEVPAALIIDLGGDDTYTRAAVVDADDMLASVVLDLRGDDTYSGTCAHARGGVAILCDTDGDDRYVSGRHSQGSAILGFALLLDMDGDDVYELEDYGQGHGTGGIGLLYDIKGDDSYTAWAFAQGADLGCGFAALVDGDGDDTYLADLHWPDIYGNSGPESYHGASQGYATGHRSSIAGGIAALLDLGDGKDRYQSGNFSQGGGYYFSFGLMFDGGGDDENHGYRYSQGFGVHQAIGVRWDAGGDDTYRCRSVAHVGMAWDEGVGWFLDDDGDDDYSVGDLGLGAAAQTGVAVFVDGGGKDIYRAGRQSIGATGSSEYHSKPSLGVMLDLGGGKDDYGSGENVGERGNNAFVTTESAGLFLDLKEKTLTKALRSKLLKKK